MTTYLTAHPADLEIAKRRIPQGMAMMIPAFHSLQPRELIHYFNMIRTLENCRDRYLPEGAIRADIYFYQAGQSEYNI